MLEERFPDTKETQPELLAHHYTEAGLIEQAIPYWQQAGQRAVQRSANVEAVSHLTKGLELLKTLPDTPERAQQELTLQLALGAAADGHQGLCGPGSGEQSMPGRESCVGRWARPLSSSRCWWDCGYFISYRAELQTAHELAEQLLRLAQSVQDSDVSCRGPLCAMGSTLFSSGKFASARVHLEQGIALYDPQQHRALSLSLWP